MTAGFPEELKRGDLQWRAVNVEQPENEHFASDYRLFSRSLVLVKSRTASTPATNLKSFYISNTTLRQKPEAKSYQLNFYFPPLAALNAMGPLSSMTSSVPAGNTADRCLPSQ